MQKKLLEFALDLITRKASEGRLKHYFGYFRDGGAL
jgi:hypothetical protein